MESTPVILVVDDDEDFREQLARSLSRRGLSVVTASDTATALARADEAAVNWAIIDLKIGAESGLDLLSQLHDRFSSVRSVILTGSRSPEIAAEATRRGAIACVSKPCVLDDLLDHLRGDR